MVNNTDEDLKESNRDRKEKETEGPSKAIKRKAQKGWSMKKTKCGSNYYKSFTLGIFHNS